MPTVQNTGINLSGTVREALAGLLNQRVGLFTDLYVQTKLAHWNVRGPHFIAYHELFDSIADHILEGQDLMAERAAQLGSTAGLTIQEAAADAKLPAWPVDMRQDNEVIRLLGERLTQTANLIREDIDTAANLKDQDTADLFTEVSRQMDKDLWFVQSHYLV